MKPENVLLAAKGDASLVKLADFGLACAAGGGRHPAASTPEYCAPEWFAPGAAISTQVGGPGRRVCVRVLAWRGGAGGMGPAAARGARGRLAAAAGCALSSAPACCAQADMWSLGVVAYVVLSGRMPFFGGSSQELEARIVAGQFTFERQWWGRVSQG